MFNDDPVFRMRLLARSAAQQVDSVKLPCQVLDIPRSTCYRWRKQWIRCGAETLPRDGRPASGQRLCGASTAGHRGVLEDEPRPLPGAQVDWPCS